jgi:hypothetical protein
MLLSILNQSPSLVQTFHRVDAELSKHNACARIYRDEGAKRAGRTNLIGRKEMGYMQRLARMGGRQMEDAESRPTNRLPVADREREKKREGEDRESARYSSDGREQWKKKQCTRKERRERELTFEN